MRRRRVRAAPHLVHAASYSIPSPSLSREDSTGRCSRAPLLPPLHHPRAPPALVRPPTLIFCKSAHTHELGFQGSTPPMASSSTGTLPEEGPWGWLPEELLLKVLE
jgi:hypothetical protein